jgi:hypothetical protein
VFQQVRPHREEAAKWPSRRMGPRYRFVIPGTRGLFKAIPTHKITKQVAWRAAHKLGPRNHVRLLIVLAPTRIFADSRRLVEINLTFSRVITTLHQSNHRSERASPGRHTRHAFFLFRAFSLVRNFCCFSREGEFIKHQQSRWIRR